VFSPFVELWRYVILTWGQGGFQPTIFGQRGAIFQFILVQIHFFIIMAGMDNITCKNAEYSSGTETKYL
jgi:hypothetical protein